MFNVSPCTPTTSGADGDPNRCAWSRCDPTVMSSSPPVRTVPMRRLLPVEEVVVRLHVLGQVPQVEDLAVAKAEDVDLVERDRRAVGPARGLVENHGRVLV